MKRCNRCKEEKERSEFNVKRRAKDGLQGECRECTRYYNHRAQAVQARARYEKTIPGCASQLRSLHGFDRPTSLHWAAILKRPEERCAICGIPNQIIEVYTRLGYHWILGAARRLTLDHITPGFNDGNYRPLCSACNSTRGPARLTDEEVLNTVRDKWQWSIGLRFLWWMNTSPGVGGRLNRSESCAKRDAQFAEGTILDPPPPTSTEESP